MERRVSPRLQAKAQKDALALANSSKQIANAKSVPTQPSPSKKSKVTGNVKTFEPRRSGDQFIHAWVSLSSSSCSSANLHASGNFIKVSTLYPAEANPLKAPTHAQGGTKESDQGAVGANASSRQEAVEEANIIVDAVKKIPSVENSSLGLSEVANMFSDDGSSQDELQSVLIDPALVSVHGYRVKPTTAPTLRAMIEKHGDIAMNCIAETVENRSILLEQVCEVMRTLQAMTFVEITEVEVKKMLSLVGDLGRVNINVGWLQKRLEEILEALELIKDYPKVKEQKQRNARIIEEAKKELKSLETQIWAIKNKANSEKVKMEAAEAENKHVTERVSNIKCKVKRYIDESLLHDLQ